MKKYKSFFIFSCLLLGSTLFAQKPKGPKVVTHSGKTSLAGGNFKGGSLAKSKFDSLIQLPLVSIDSSNKYYPVNSFYMTYIEQALYEDSAGHPLILADYYGFTSIDGQIPEEWLESLLSRAKAGDTVLITNVESNYNDKKKTVFYTEPVKIIITK